MATFACPSPKGTNNAKLFLNSRGELLDRRGNYWGRSQIARMAQDQALDPPVAFGAERKWTPNDWQASHTRKALEAALQEATEAHGLDNDQHRELLDLIHRHLKGEAQEGRGMGATDRNKGKGALDDATVEERVREILEAKGLDEETITEAIERVRADRAAAKDRRPENAIHSGMGGHISGVSKDAERSFEEEYPDSRNTTRDVYGEPHSESFDPNVGKPGYNPRVYAAGLRAAEALSGSGVSRRLSNDGALDEDIE
jgi:hypothetical protein